MSKRKLLLSDDDDDDKGHQQKISINKAYANKYEEKKKQQELARLEEKYKDGWSTASDSESEEDEDDDGDLLTADVDAKILTTIATIKARDPVIYAKDVRFFEEENQQASRQACPKATRPDKDAAPDARLSKFATSQAGIKDELKRAFYGDGDEEEEEEEESAAVLTKKVKSKEELGREEDEYKEFLLQNLKSNPNAQQAMQDWIAYGNQGRDAPVALSADDQFLVDYVMNRGWIDKTNANEHRVEAIVDEVEASEEEADRADAFEEAYNFRYEHPQAGVVVTYPRDNPDSMRRKDSKRQREREAAKQRKQEEKIRQKEELKRLKSLRREELTKKAERLIRVAGTDVAKRLLQDSSDSDFDPDEHDKKMSAVFGDQYYEQVEGRKDLREGQVEEVEGVEGGEGRGGERGVEAHALDTKPIGSMLKRAKASMPEDVKKTIEEELHKLDYEDRIGDIQCRFKYCQVPQSSFGLDMHELLTVDDKALNEHVAMKKLAPYLPKHQQLRDMKKYGNKRRVWTFRNNLRGGGYAGKQ